MKDGKVTRAFYDADAKLVGTTSHKLFTDMRLSMHRNISTRNIPATLKTAIVFFDDNEFNETDMTMYGNQFDDADNYFCRT